MVATATHGCPCPDEEKDGDDGVGPPTVDVGASAPSKLTKCPPITRLGAGGLARSRNPWRIATTSIGLSDLRLLPYQLTAIKTAWATNHPAFSILLWSEEIR